MLTGHLETAPFVWPVCRSNGSPASGSVCEPFLRAQGTTDCVSSPVLGSVFKLFSVFRSNFGDFNHPGSRTRYFSFDSCRMFCGWKFSRQESDKGRYATSDDRWPSGLTSRPSPRSSDGPSPGSCSCLGCQTRSPVTSVAFIRVATTYGSTAGPCLEITGLSAYVPRQLHYHQ